jgi:hypothetical protein
MINERSPDSVSNALARHVINGWAEAAAHNDHVSAIKRNLNGLCDATFVVTNRCHEIQVDSNIPQFASDIDGVGVGDFTEENFCPDCYNFGIHRLHKGSVPCVNRGVTENQCLKSLELFIGEEIFAKSGRRIIIWTCKGKGS